MEADDAWLLSAADLAGTHALIAFFSGLALLLLATGFIVRLLQRHPVRHANMDRPLALLFARFIFGFVVIISGGALFAILADEIDIDDELSLFDARFTSAVTHHTPAPVVRLFSLVTHLGDPAVLIAIGIVVAVLLLLRGQRWLMLGWVMAAGGNGLLNPTLKAMFERVRPLNPEGLPLTEGWSFPSGHASGAVVVYGMLSYVLVRNLPRPWHLPVILLAVVIAFSTGWSRIFLQFHYASDVLAGFASGTAWLTVCIAAMEYTRWRAAWKTPSLQA